MGHLTAALAAFFRWWAGELTALVPAVLRRELGRGTGMLVLDVSGGDIAVHRISGGAARELGRVPAMAPHGLAERDALSRLLGGAKARRLPLVLRLPAANALRKTLNMPLAAEENLREVLSFEMDRETPFTAAQVYFDFHIGDRDRDAERMEVELLAIPRSDVDGVLMRSAAWGIVPEAVDVAGAGIGGVGLPRFNLLPGGAEAAENRRGPTAALVIIALVLAAVAIYLPLDREHRTAALYTAALATARVGADAAIALRRQVETMTAESGWLVGHKRSAPALAVLLETVTVPLPDGTWLSRLDMDDKKVRLTGSSQAAGSLISLIENAPVFEKVRFVAPVTRDAKTGVERFSLSAAFASPKSAKGAKAGKGAIKGTSK